LADKLPEEVAVGLMHSLASMATQLGDRLHQKKGAASRVLQLGLGEQAWVLEMPDMLKASMVMAATGLVAMVVHMVAEDGVFQMVPHGGSHCDA